ncbi:hypothetical protein ACJZ2D_001232 [Fusarium nematophilum]
MPLELLYRCIFSCLFYLAPIPEHSEWQADYFFRSGVRNTNRFFATGQRQRAYSRYRTVKSSVKDCYGSAKRFGSYQVKKYWARNRDPQTQQHADDCFLLRRLPPDLILNIADQLPPHSRVFFSWTCRTVRNVLRANGLPESRDLRFREAVDFLTLLGRDRQGRYVCEKCLRLHRVTLKDTPHGPWFVSCPVGSFGHNGAPCMLRSYALDPRHVQLALKYSRMENRSRKADRYLEKLLEPARCPDIALDFRHQKRVSMCFVTPRVVRGHFILQSVWMYPSHGIRWSGVLEGDVCYLVKRQRKVFPWYDPEFALVDEPAPPSPACTFCWPATAAAAAALHTAQDRAKKDMGTRVMGYDRRNPVDYAVMVEDGRLMFWSWQDLGVEGTTLDLAWGRSRRRTGSRRGEGRMGHAPGGVRKMFDEGRGLKIDRFDFEANFDDDDTIMRVYGP